MPAQFYIGADADLRRCRESRETGRPITITGTTEDRKLQTFTGIVQALEYVRRNPGDLSWHVTMRDDAES